MITKSALTSPTNNEISNKIMMFQKMSSVNTSTFSVLSQKCTLVNSSSNIGSVFKNRSPGLRNRYSQSRVVTEGSLEFMYLRDAKTDQLLKYLDLDSKKLGRLFQIVQKRYKQISRKEMKYAFQVMHITGQYYFSEPRALQLSTPLKWATQSTVVSISQELSGHVQKFQCQKESCLLLRIIKRNKIESGMFLLLKAIDKSIYRKKTEFLTKLAQKINIVPVESKKTLMTFAQLLQSRLQSTYYQTFLKLAQITKIKKSRSISELGLWETIKVDSANIDLSNKEKVAVQFAGAIWINALLEKKIFTTKHYFFSKLTQLSLKRCEIQISQLNDPFQLLDNGNFIERDLSTIYSHSSHDSMTLKRIILEIPDEVSPLNQIVFQKSEPPLPVLSLVVPPKSSLKMTSPRSGNSNVGAPRKSVQLQEQINISSRVWSREHSRQDQDNQLANITDPLQFDRNNSNNSDLLQSNATPKSYLMQTPLAINDIRNQDVKLSKSLQSPKLGINLPKVSGSIIIRTPSQLLRRRDSFHSKLLQSVNSYVKHKPSDNKIIELGKSRNLLKVASLILPSLQKKSWISGPIARQQQIQRAKKIPEKIIVKNQIKATIKYIFRKQWVTIALLLLIAFQVILKYII